MIRRSNVADPVLPRRVIMDTLLNRNQCDQFCLFIIDDFVS